MRHLQEPITSVNESSPSRRTLSPLGRTTAFALLGLALTLFFQFFFLWLALGLRIIPLLVFGLLTGIASGLVFARLGFAPLLGALWAGVLTVILLVVSDTISALLHPAYDPGHFGSTLFTLALAFVAIVAGIATTIQVSQNRGSSSPGWLAPLLSGVICFAVGSLIVAAIAGENLVGASAQATTNGVPTVHMTGGNFLTAVVLVKKGQKLMLADDDATQHHFQNGAWTASGVPESLIEPGSPVVHSLTLTQGSTQIGPFSTAGVFHLYCTLHRGMNLTVVVEERMTDDLG